MHREGERIFLQELQSERRLVDFGLNETSPQMGCVIFDLSSSSFFSALRLRHHQYFSKDISCLPFRGESSLGERGMLMDMASDTSLSGYVMASGHLVWSIRSTAIKHIGVSDVLLWVPMKISDVPSSGG